MPRLKTIQPAPPPPPPGIPLSDKLAFTILEAAAILSLGLTTTRALIAAEKIKAVRAGQRGGALIIPRTSIEAYLAHEVAKAG